MFITTLAVLFQVNDDLNYITVDYYIVYNMKIVMNNRKGWKKFVQAEN